MIDLIDDFWNFILEVTCNGLTSHPGRGGGGSSNTPSSFMPQKSELIIESCEPVGNLEPKSSAF